jgi:glycosyltransferase involved in cell wall biosynthesis
MIRPMSPAAEAIKCAPGAVGPVIPTEQRTLGRILVVVPAYNEHSTVAQVVADITRLGHDCLVVDDGSTDRTAEHARAAGADVLTLRTNRGVGGALQAGFRYAVEHGYDAVVQVDADGQHPVEHIGDLLEAAHHTGASLVVGNRFHRPCSYPISFPRRRLIALFARLMSPHLGFRPSDPTSGFRVIRTPLLEHFAAQFPQHYLGDTVEATLAAARVGYRIVEAPVTMQPRTSGRSPVSRRRAVGGLLRAYRAVLSVTTASARARICDGSPSTASPMHASAPTDSSGHQPNGGFHAARAKSIAEPFKPIALR